jgi:hypothetical protein
MRTFKPCSSSAEKGESVMQHSTAPIEVEQLGNPMCRSCGVAMRLYGVESHPTLQRTDLRTYICPRCEAAAVSNAFHSPARHSTRTQPASLARRLPPPGELGIEPERIESMHLAYEKACAALGLSVQPDKINEVLVTKIVELGITENWSADLLCERVLAHFGADTRFADEFKS